VTFTPVLNYNGTATPISYTVEDNLGLVSNTATLTVTVTAVNDAPVANNDTTTSIPSTAGATAINALTATDIDGTIASYIISSLPSNGVLALSGVSVTINQVLTPTQVALLTYDPSGTFTGTDIFTFTATDNNGALDVTPATITIPVRNNAPIANNNINAGIPSTAAATLIAPLTATDTDGTIASYTILSLPTNGILALSGIAVNINQMLTPAQAALLTYDPSGSFSGNDSFTFTATDNNGSLDLTPATITVGVNSSIDANNEVMPAVSGGIVTTTTSLFGNDTVNGNPFTPSQVTLATLPIGGGIVMNANGTLTIPANAPSGSYSVSYTICTVATPSACDTATATIVVNPSIDATNDPTTTVAAGVQTIIPTLFGNDTVNGNSFTPSQITVTTLPIGGGIVMNADGTLTIPANAPSGSYLVTYTICTKATPVVCDSATKTIIVAEKPSIAIVKTATFNDENADGYAQAGETISYAFVVTNTGNVALTNVSVKDNYLPGVILTGSPMSLGIGETNSTAYTAIYSIKQNDINIGSIENQATVTATSLNGTVIIDLSDNTSNLDDKPTVLGVSGCVIEVFNAISPNEDGLNKVFYIRGLECYPKNTVEIYNRWGVLVFERSGYNNADRAFKGISEGRVTVNQSEELPEGTYYYILRYTDSASTGHEKAGYLYINR
jgi:gliding motility-associated-like protein